MKVDVGKDNIVISDFNALDVFRIAIKLEKDGAAAYKNAAEKSTSERMKKTFVRLAEDEEEHLRVFNVLYEELLKEKGLDPADVDVEENIFQYIDSGIFAGIKNFSMMMTPKDIIKVGIEVEMRTLLFYSEVYKKTENHAAQLKIKRIIEAEKMHYNILKSWEAAC